MLDQTTAPSAPTELVTSPSGSTPATKEPTREQSKGEDTLVLTLVMCWMSLHPGESAVVRYGVRTVITSQPNWDSRGCRDQQVSDETCCGWVGGYLVGFTEEDICDLLNPAAVHMLRYCNQEHVTVSSLQLRGSEDEQQ